MPSQKRGSQNAKNTPRMKSTSQSILTINGGSSSIKFALFETGGALRRMLQGSIERIGQPGAVLRVKGAEEADNFTRQVAAPDHTAAVDALMDWLEQRIGRDSLAAVGHRVVHGGPKYNQPERITAEMVAELKELSAFDPAHLPEEILLTVALHHRFPGLFQVACFDTAFHHDMPRVAQLLPIPRRYETQGVRRYGFHGLSYAFLMEELERLDGGEAARGRGGARPSRQRREPRGGARWKIRGHQHGLHPHGGDSQGTRTGDLDPGLVRYLMSAGKMDADQFNDMVNFESGLLGISETSSDMQDLLGREASDVRAAEAVAVFCYEARKWIGAFAAALGGLETLVFAGGIGGKRARHPGADLRGTRLSRHRAGCRAECKKRAADLPRGCTRESPRDPHGRGIDDREIGRKNFKCCLTYKP